MERYKTPFLSQRSNRQTIVRRRRNVTFILTPTVSDESGGVSEATVDSWKERLPEIYKEYTAECIWNVDETGWFWQEIPDRGLGQMKASCKGGKRVSIR